MNKELITIIDYGIGNLLNVVRAFEHIGAQVKVAESKKDIISAGKLVLPGVGAFANGMHELKVRDFIEPIKAHARSGDPLLGICLGMQMLFDSSEEFELAEGLRLIPGKVVKIPDLGVNGTVHKIPHIGWNELLEVNSNSWNNSIFHNVAKSSATYFVHSFMGVPSDDRYRLANCDYNGVKICAAIQRDNVSGCQFHPERSGEIGLNILSNFLNKE
jgi:imidazole glycerol-phosphate synthase subunit HisH